MKDLDEERDEGLDDPEPFEKARERRLNRDRWNAARIDAGFAMLEDSYDGSPDREA
jgi:hypothetical protein